MASNTKSHSKVYIYCRISSVGQDKGVSLEAQESALKSIANQLNWKIAHIQKVTSSAYKQNADGLDFYADLHNKKILIYSVDRFSRDVELGSELAKELLENNNTLYFFKEQFYLDKYEPEANKWKKFVHALTISENESKLISERVIMGKRKARELGRFNGGKTPFGFKKIKTIEEGYNKLVLDDTVEPIIKLIVACRTTHVKIETLNSLIKECGGLTEGEHKLVLDGGYSNRVEYFLSYGTIQDILNEYSIAGRKWTSSLVKTIYEKFCDKVSIEITKNKDIVNFIKPETEDIEFINKLLGEEAFFE